MWGRKREEKFREKEVRRRQKEIGVNGGKEEREVTPLKAKMFPELAVLPHGWMRIQ